MYVASVGRLILQRFEDDANQQRSILEVFLCLAQLVVQLRIYMTIPFQLTNIRSFKYSYTEYTYTYTSVNMYVCIPVGTVPLAAYMTQAWS